MCLPPDIPIYAELLQQIEIGKATPCMAFVASTW
jgi:hypothetical protein